MGFIKFRYLAYALVCVLMQYEQTSLSNVRGQVDLAEDFSSLGSFRLEESSCVQSGEKQSIKSKYPLRVYIKEHESYFLKKIDSSCSYLQYFSIHSLGDKSFNISFGKTKKIGSCYFNPESLIASPLETANVQTDFEKNTLYLSWEVNPSLQFCQGQSVVWSLKQERVFYRKLKLAKTATSESITYPKLVN